MSVPMLDLKLQYTSIKDEVDEAVARVLESQQFRGGPEADAFEQELANYSGVKHALGVSSGTDAILLMVKALGFSCGDEIITTPFSFFATGGALVNAGITPVFADIQPDTFNLDPNAVRAALSDKTKAVMPVHLYGQCADIEELRAIADEAGVPLLEDAAQAIGAQYHGTPAGGLGQAAALSFYPTKNLGAAGEGGAILTNDDAVAEQVKLLRCHGSSVQYEHQIVGTNSHLHSLQAAVLRVKLRHLDCWNNARRQHAAQYRAALQDTDGITLPLEREHNHHVYHQFVIRIRERDRCVERLREANIGCGVFYPKPLHLQDCFQNIARVTPCPEAERASQEVLALPIFPELTEQQIDTVIAALKNHIDLL